MNAGKLDQFITIERRATATDGMGGFIDAWATHCEVWANVKAKAGREGLSEGRTNAVYVVNFTIYNIADLSELDRIVWNEETYNIRNIMREGNRALHVKIEAERGVAS
jgi:head-tail adaptor